jgi:hypothetical protein
MRAHALVLAICLGAVLGWASEAQARCRLHQAPTKVTHRAPPAGLLSHLAVLRRPQEPADIPADKHFGHGLRLLAIDYVRRLGVGLNGESYYLVPGSFAALRHSRGCLRGLSPGRRRLEQRIEREARRRERTIGLGLFQVGARANGGSGFADLHGLLANETGLTFGTDRRSTTMALVPDGVASVTLRWHHGFERNPPVANNFWVTKVPFGADRAFPVSTIWRAADGTRVTSFRSNRVY